MALKNYAVPTVTISTVADLVVPAANKETAVLTLLITNNETANAAIVLVTLTDSANTVKGTIWRGTLTALESIAVDLGNKGLFIASSATPDRIRVISDRANTSFIASGDES